MRIRLVATAMAMLIGLAAASPTPRPRARPDVRIWRLNCGQLQVNDASAFSDTGELDGRSIRFTDSCYLIRHDRELLLWDAGLPVALLHAPFTGDQVSPSLEVDLPTQLTTLGVRPADIRWLALSHYHWDHVGQASAFPGATLLIGDLDWKALHAKEPPFGADPGLLAHWLSGEGKVDAFHGDRDVFGDRSVLILSSPGHTPGSAALLVRPTHSHPVILSGDVMVLNRSAGRAGVPTWNTSRAESLASADRLRGLARNMGATIVVQHDPADVGKLARFPTPDRRGALHRLPSGRVAGVARLVSGRADRRRLIYADLTQRDVAPRGVAAWLRARTNHC